MRRPNDVAHATADGSDGPLLVRMIVGIELAADGGLHDEATRGVLRREVGNVGTPNGGLPLDLAPDGLEQGEHAQFEVGAEEASVAVNALPNVGPPCERYACVRSFQPLADGDALPASAAGKEARTGLTQGATPGHLGHGREQ